MCNCFDFARKEEGPISPCHYQPWRSWGGWKSGGRWWSCTECVTEPGTISEMALWGMIKLDLREVPGTTTPRIWCRSGWSRGWRTGVGGVTHLLCPEGSLLRTTIGLLTRRFCRCMMRWLEHRQAALMEWKRSWARWRLALFSRRRSGARKEMTLKVVVMHTSSEGDGDYPVSHGARVKTTAVEPQARPLL